MDSATASDVWPLDTALYGVASIPSGSCGGGLPLWADLWLADYVWARFFFLKITKGRMQFS